MTQFTGAPIFDADQHMYETPESLTKFLPEKYSRAVQYGQFGRHTRIVINNRVNDFIPNPTFERVAAPGAHEKFFAGENTEGSPCARCRARRSMRPPATRNPVDRVAELDRQGVVEALNYPTLASLIEHATADDPELSLAIIHALNQWMLEHWTFNYERPRLLDADHQPLRGRRRPARAGVSTRQRRQGRADQARPGEWYPRLAVTRAAGVRPVLARRRGRRTAGRAARQLSPARRLRRQVGAAVHPELHGAERLPLDGAGAPRDLRHDHRPDLPRHADPLPEVARRQRRERQLVDLPVVQRLRGPLQEDAAELPRAPARRLPPQHLGQPVLGGLRLRRREHRRLGQGAVRLGLSAPRGAGRTERLLEVRRGHGRAAHLRLHGRQRPAVHGLPIANPDPAAVKPPALSNV